MFNSLPTELQKRVKVFSVEIIPVSRIQTIFAPLRDSLTISAAEHSLTRLLCEAYPSFRMSP